MTPDLLVGLWATGLVIGLSLTLGFLLCWISAWSLTEYV